MKQISALFIIVVYLRPIIGYNYEEVIETHNRTERLTLSANRSFVIDYNDDVFLKDGKPFHYVSGSFHYFQAPRAYWRDRLRKMRAAGLNAVSTYIEWSSHESSRRNYKFDGDVDFEYFFQLADEEGLLVILRPGPYICAERDFGGLPAWLLTLYPNIRVRSNDTDFKNEVKGWFEELFKRIEKHLYGNGGPIIMVQVENEYGGYIECDMDYRIFLRDEVQRHVRDAAVLYTTDGPDSHSLECGHVPGVYATVDFGTWEDAKAAFTAMRKVSPRGPLVNSEFYTGWYSRWEERMARVDTDKLYGATKVLLDMKANFNFYMFFGGTNFGFTNGANGDGGSYKSVVTSYDFDAPLNESGDCTPKYWALRDLISKYYKLPDIPVPGPSKKGNYGKVRVEAALSTFNTSYIEDKIVLVSEKPLTFEQMGVNYGYMLYETAIPDNIPDPVILHAPGVRDRAIVYVDQVPIGILTRNDDYGLPLLAAPGQTLSLLVENRGRIDYGGQLKDTKGLLAVPSLSGRLLVNWTMTGLPFKNVSWVCKLPKPTHKIIPPAVYVGELVLPSQDTPSDTFVDLTGWGKGIIFINDFNLGRYWPSVGSQVTLYVPGCYLRGGPQKNTIIVVETERAPDDQEITFTDKPILDRIPPTEEERRTKLRINFAAKGPATKLNFRMEVDVDKKTLPYAI